MVRGSYLGGSIDTEHKLLDDQLQEGRETRPTVEPATFGPSLRISEVPSYGSLQQRRTSADSTQPNETSGREVLIGEAGSH